MIKLLLRTHLCALIAIIFISGCSKKEEMPFTPVQASQSNIHFINQLESTPEFNIRNYLYFYDGGGIAVGDINNDGLPDLFFSGNQSENRLYINKGNFEFEDITESAGIINDEGSWSTGVTMADVNGNGYLDIYVSRVNYLSVSGKNQLFINNGDNTFTEMADEYGLDFEGYSTQAAFLDYNKSGRLDLFLLNHSFHSENTYGEADVLRQLQDPKGGDRLFRNDGNHFTDVTEQSGIISSALGYGLGVAIKDINLDGYPDIYVGNDFHEDDYFYINNGDGTFTESLYKMIGHTSNSSMGNDVGDINNDGLMDLISLDMMSENHDSFMRSGGPDLKILADTKQSFGFGFKNNRNTLQINRGLTKSGLPHFSETAFASGVARTDWSWAALIADYTNNGYSDLFITNGMPHRPNDLDIIVAINQLREEYSGSALDQKEFELIESMPQILVSNYMFKNNGDLTFTNVTDSMGFSQPDYSSGAVYADLNNDGLLDLVTNNINEKASIYENRTIHSDSTRFLKIKLTGDSANSTGIGSKLFLYKDDIIFSREQTPVRGFQSSVDQILHIGLADHTNIDSLLVIWPDDRYQVLYDVDSNQTLELFQVVASDEFNYEQLHQKTKAPLITDITEQTKLNHRHWENSFDDMRREPLIPYKLSKNGPALAIADVNGNGLDDIYIGGASGFEGKLLMQQDDGSYLESSQPFFFADRGSEDVDALFFDATGDGNPDLYVVSGGNEFTRGSPELLDRLYINTGNGEFRKSVNSIPEFTVNGSVVKAADINGNGHLDLFVGGHSVPWRYGIGPQSFILLNNGNGIFQDATEHIAQELQTIGNVTTAEWIYQPDKEVPDLIVTGEWMPIHFFENQDGIFTKQTDKKGFQQTNGLWQTVTVSDLTGNGYPDIIAGNFGINSRLKASFDSPINLYVNDFDDSGQTAPVLSYFVDGVEKPFEQLDELRAQIPDITNRVRSYRDFASKRLNELFNQTKLDEALKKQIYELRSIVLLNRGDGTYHKEYLPFEAQLFPVKAILAGDITGNGFNDLLLAGNIYDVKPSMGGRQDAGYGLLLSGDGTGNFQPIQYRESGFIVNGEARSIMPLKEQNGDYHIIVVRNNNSPLIFKRFL